MSRTPNYQNPGRGSVPPKKQAVPPTYRDPGQGAWGASPSGAYGPQRAWTRPPKKPLTMKTFKYPLFGALFLLYGLAIYYLMYSFSPRMFGDSAYPQLAEAFSRLFLAGVTTLGTSLLIAAVYIIWFFRRHRDLGALREDLVPFLVSALLLLAGLFFLPYFHGQTLTASTVRLIQDFGDMQEDRLTTLYSSSFYEGHQSKATPFGIPFELEDGTVVYLPEEKQPEINSSIQQIAIQCLPHTGAAVSADVQAETFYLSNVSEGYQTVSDYDVVGHFHHELELDLSTGLLDTSWSSIYDHKEIEVPCDLLGQLKEQKDSVLSNLSRLTGKNATLLVMKDNNYLVSVEGLLQDQTVCSIFASVDYQTGTVLSAWSFPKERTTALYRVRDRFYILNRLGASAADDPYRGGETMLHVLDPQAGTLYTSPETIHCGYQPDLLFRKDGVDVFYGYYEDRELLGTFSVPDTGLPEAEAS